MSDETRATLADRDVVPRASGLAEPRREWGELSEAPGSGMPAGYSSADRGCASACLWSMGKLIRGSGVPGRSGRRGVGEDGASGDDAEPLGPRGSMGDRWWVIGEVPGAHLVLRAETAG
ncbi:MAG: hypothetical protein ACK5KO_10205 [Arachnia sp.]